MTILHYIDNEVPWDAPTHYGEWDDAAEAGGSTIRQLAAASHPDRPSTGSGLGLRVATTADNSAYVRKTGLAQVAPGESTVIGYWFRITGLPGDYTRFCRLAGTAGSPYVDTFLYSGATGSRVAFFGDDGTPNWSNYIHPATGRWVYVVVRVTRATTSVAADGSGELWMDGVSAGQVTGIDNYDRMGVASNVLSLGCVADARDGYQADFDEIKIAAAYPPPTVPAPEGEYLTARRLCVLYRPACADSREFADYCADELGVPRANLIPLPNATDDETPADYTSFQTQVESGIDAYFALNPTVADNCAGFLIGFGVPGYFMHAGVKHSATSRLNRYGTAFSSGTSNPLFGGEAGMPGRTSRSVPASVPRLAPGDPL